MATIAQRRSIGGNRRPIKAAAMLANDLAAQIIDENLLEGDRLPPEKEMIATTGRARGTLREALRLLESRGVIEIRQGIGGGPVVRGPRPSDLGDALMLLLMFERASIMDLVDARAEIEILVIERAAKTITTAQIQDLRDVTERQKKHIEDRDLFLACSREIHKILNRAAGSLVLGIINEALVSTAHAVFIPFNYPIAHRRRVIASHVELIAAFETGDAERACDVMRQHVKESAESWRRYAGPMADRPLRWNPMDRLD